MFSEDFTLTKQHLGWLLLALGGAGFVAVLAVDFIAIARAGGVGSIFTAATIEHLRSPLGIGPAQRLALMACVALAAVGGTLLPLGNRPA